MKWSGRTLGKIGGDAQMIGALVYLIGIGAWLSGPTNAPDSNIGWALIVAIIGNYTV